MFDNQELLRQLSYTLTQLCFRRLDAVGRRIGAQEELSMEAYGEIRLACASAVDMYILRDTDLVQARRSMEEIGREYMLWAPAEEISLPEGMGSDAEAIADFLLAGEVKSACEQGLPLSDFRMAFCNKDVHTRMHAVLLSIFSKHAQQQTI